MSEQKDTAERKKKLLDLVKQLSELSEEDLYFLIGYLEGKQPEKENMNDGETGRKKSMSEQRCNGGRNKKRKN